MPLIETDFSEAKTFELLPVGDYNVRITDSALKKSQRTGNSYIAWTFEIFNSPTGNGRRLWCNTTFHGKGAGMLKSLIDATLLQNFAGGAFNTDLLMGKECVANIKHEPKQDGSGFRETITRFYPIGGSAATSTQTPNFDSFEATAIATKAISDQDVPF